MAATSKIFLGNVEFEPNSGCWLWAGPVNRKGYGHLWHDGLHMLAHRVAYTRFRGEVPPGLHVLHKCDTPACVNPDHLKVGTNEENVADRVARGRSKSGQAYGEGNSASKLTTEDILAIRAMGGTQDAIAAKFGINQSTVSMIRRRKLWAHV